jgi:hypothetical protein
VLQVSKAECHLSSLLSTGLGWEAFPIINLAREVLGCKDRYQGHHDKFDIRDRHAGPRCLFLCILHHDNEMGDAICLQVVLHHNSVQHDHVKGMKPSTVGIKEHRDVDGHDLCVEGVGIFQVIVPNFIDNIAEKFGPALLGRLVTGIVIKLGFVGSLRMNTNNHCCIISNSLFLEWKTSWAYEFGTIVSFLLDIFSEDSRDKVNPIQLVVGDAHEQWEKGLLDG